MSINYGYYLPLSENLFATVRFIDITEKPDGIGQDAQQARDKDGTPRWVVSALVRLGDHKQETETFTLTAPLAVAQEIDAIDELADIRLLGLAAGKWTRANSDKTSWSFQIDGIEVLP